MPDDWLIEMRAKLTNEIYWLLGTVILTGVIGVWIFGNQILDSTPVEVQLHDTYYVFTKAILLKVIFIGLLTTTYLARWIYFRLNNKVVNGILTILLLVILVVLIMYQGWMSGLESQLKIVYSKVMDDEIQANALSSFKITIRTLWTLILIIGTILAITVYKTFKPIKVNLK